MISCKTVFMFLYSYVLNKYIHVWVYWKVSGNMRDHVDTLGLYTQYLLQKNAEKCFQDVLFFSYYLSVLIIYNLPKPLTFLSF